MNHLVLAEATEWDQNSTKTDIQYFEISFQRK